jgi:hypothetical protein
MMVKDGQLFMTAIQLDPQRLLGFRLEARETVSLDGNRVNTGATRGTKTGIKPGNKPVGIKPEVRIGIKAGGKLGTKPTLSV